MHAARWIVLLVVALAGVPARGQEAAAPDFNQQILPLFKQYCLGCHGAQDAEHGLVLESYESLLAGGDGGAVLAAGKSDDSRLMLMLDGRAEPAMPPEGNEKPTAEEIAIVKAWIDAGAKGPSGAGPDPTILITPKVALLAPARRLVNSVAISPDGKLAAVAGYGEVRLISMETRAAVRTLEGLRGNVTDVTFSADGAKLIAAAGEPGVFGEARIYQVSDGALLTTLVGHRDSLYAAALSPDGKLLATGGYDQQIHIWDAATGQLVRTLAGHNGAVFAMAFSPQGQWLASASADRTVKLWDVATGTRLDTFGQSLKEVYTLAFSPDGRRIAAGGVDNRIRVWQLSETAQEGTNPLLLSRFAHEGAIIELTYSQDGATLVSSAEDRSIRIWDAAGVSEKFLLEPQPDWAPALAVGPDNKTLLVGRLDGSLAFYDATTAQPIAPPKPELTAIEPRGVQRGVATRVKLLGKNLLDLSEVRFSSGQLQATLLPAVADMPDERFAEITPAGDLTRGAYQVSVANAGGASAEVALYVDDLPQAAETEPNNQAAQAAPVALPAGYWGLLSTRGDVDHFRFEAQPGQLIVFELSAKKLGSALNAVLTVLDPAGEVVASNNDFDGQDDPLLAYRAPAAGVYTVRVTDQALGGSDKHYYRLTMGELPYITGCYPLSVASQQETQIELAGFNLPADAKIALAAGPAGDRPLPIDLQRFRVGRPLSVLASDGVELLEAEPNDQPEQATAIAAPANVAGRIWAQAGQTADVDLFRFEARAGQSWIIEVEADRRGSPVDSKLEILDAQGHPAPRMLLQAVRDSYIDFRGVDSNGTGVRPKNWEEMELNEYVYLQGEVCRIFRLPQGPDSDIQFYALGGRRKCYFDTSATSHTFEESLYIVEPHPADARLAPNGLPIFTLFYSNDDDAERKLGRDSRLTFTAPADGAYLVRVSDVRNFEGDRFAYRLVVREPKPDFQVTLADVNAAVSPGSGRRLTFNVNRLDGFDGDITIAMEGLPPGFSASTPLVIQAGHVEARAVLVAAADAAMPAAEVWNQVKITATADVAGSPRVHQVGSLGQVKLAEKPKLIVRIEPADLTIAPGTTIAAMLKVERHGHDDLINFEVDNLPHGVIVDNIGLNGVLIRAGETERQIFLKAAAWTPDTDRPFHAVATVDSQASAPAMLRVRKPATVASAEGQ